MTEVKSQKVKSILKDLLKKKGITYEEVAQELGCSLPTVNRILGPEEISLNRILEICEIVDLSFTELGVMMKETSHEDSEFSDSQQVFLSKNPGHFAYLLKIMSGETPTEIAAESKLNQRSTDKYLIALENQGLIHVSGKNKVRPTIKRLHMGKGPLAKVHFEKTITAGGKFFVDYIRRGLNGAEQNSARVALNGSKMTRASYDNYVEEQKRLMQRFMEISDMEEKIKKPSELMTAVITYGHALVNNDDPALIALDKAFGEIKNL